MCVFVRIYVSMVEAVGGCRGSCFDLRHVCI
jgi:hypothetical protein